MAELLQLDWKAFAKEANIRALLEDFVSHYKGVEPTLFPGGQLAMAVWFGRAPQSSEHHLLMLFTAPPMNTIDLHRPAQPLLWNIGHEGPPFIQIYWTSVDYFAQQLVSNPQAVAHYCENFEVLYFDKQLVHEPILSTFNVQTEPTGLIKGWYVSGDEYQRFQTVRSMLASRGQARPGTGIVKTQENPDYETCQALIHVEVGQKWVPISPEGLHMYSYYNDWIDNRPGYLLFQGGALYKIDRFEVKTYPKYSELVLEKLRDDRYPEVYLRAVHLPDQPAA